MLNDQVIGQWHYLLIYPPTILFIGALVADTLTHYGKFNTLLFGHLCVIFASLSCIPAIYTGLAAAEGLDLNNFFLAKHSYLGYSTGIFGSFYAGLRISAWRWLLPLRPMHYMGLSLLMVALVSWTSDYGQLVAQKVYTHHSSK